MVGSARAGDSAGAAAGAGGSAGGGGGVAAPAAFLGWLMRRYNPQDVYFWHGPL